MFREFRDLYGWSTIPLKEDGSKRPSVAWKQFQERLPTDDEVDGWEKNSGRVRTDPQVAIVTGAVSGLIVLDIDSEEGWDAIHGLALPPTPAVWSTEPLDNAPLESNPRGRAHYYFKHPGPNYLVKSGPIKGRKFKGIDIKADGGYVVAPPSWHGPSPSRPDLPEGWNYTWMIQPDDHPVADLPKWLKDILIIQKIGGNPAAVMISREDLLPDDSGDWLVDAFRGISGPRGNAPGERNVTGAKVAGYFLHYGLAPEVVVNVLHAWNIRNVPPLPTADIKKIVHSVANSENRKKHVAYPERGEVESAKEHQPRLMEYINAKLNLSDGNRIVEIRKFLHENADFTMTLASGAEIILTATAVLQQAKTKAAFLTHCDHVIPKVGGPKDKTQWDDVVRAISTSAVNVNVGAEGTAKGVLSGALERFLMQNPPEIIDHDDLPEEAPFIWKEKLYLQAHAFLSYLYMRERQNLSAQQLARILRGTGWVNQQIGKDRQRCWLAPSDFKWYESRTSKKKPPPDNVVPFKG